MAKPKAFKNIKSKRLGKKAAKITGMKRGTVRRIMRAMNIVIDEWAADRPKYFSRFINTWRGTAGYVDVVGDAVLENPSLAMPKESVEMMFSPYDFCSFTIFYPLAQTLNYAEELELVETGKALERAWGKFLDAAAMRPHVAAADVAALRAAVAYLNPRVVGMYQGTAKSEFDAEWIGAREVASAALGRIMEGLAK